MNIWQAVVEVVRSFNEAGNPAFALAAIAVMLIGLPIISLAVLSLKRLRKPD